ncbi:M1 family metallopeptidase [Nocardioides sp. SR21]|uniref:M1 family metallopeptidase n=1 Tax=Nocardioides sp. SR21 TaxID=2919501 RepID=UPI001FAA72AF|nr:M1 family metallopeptidase [Nocardioides sp. SR21]
MIRRSLALAVATGLIAAPLVSSQPASGRAEDPRGASGIGDPYFPLDGNGGIDVQSYDVHDRYQFGERRLSGWTRIMLRPTADLAGFNLDLLLPVQSVRIDGDEVDFEHSGHELEISAPVAEGELVNVVVKYAGFPGRYSYAGESNWLANRHEVVAMNQPHMAPWWFPANDHPLDRAAIKIAITAPKGKQVIANGNRVARTVHGRLATTTWLPDEPMVPYLAFFAAGEFAVAKGADHGHPWVVAVSKRLSPDLREHGMSLLKKSAKYTAWIEDVLGADYPFSTTGGVATSLEPGFALENQTRPTYSPGSLNTSTVIHELAHQWFGDSVAVEGWKDIWLNEGFATFFEIYYAEEAGNLTGDQWLRDQYDGLPANSDFWDHEVADPCPTYENCVSSIFAWWVYNRGGMALQALRNVIGDDDFFEVLRTWVTDREGGNGTTSQFEALAEEVSGQDLDAFFDAWLHDMQKPADTVANGLG